ncbi:MAG: hypothetical protein IKT05_01770 [Fibrobacter sp.]|nr:hypothetical protein [Fibrobacter sp.]
MNKKIYVGMMAFGVAATFWACGSGDIIKADKDDETMSIIVEDNPSLGVSKDVMTRETCPQCFEGSVLPSSSSKKQTPVSSATVSSSSSPFGPQSSSSEMIINLNSSSSRPIIIYSSSSTIGPILLSSSSAQVPSPGGIGTCEPNPATIDLGGKTTWKYTRGDEQPSQLLKATFAWEFEGGSPATANVTGAGGMSQSITYTTSGVHVAKLVLTMGASHYSVTCSPLQVNGAAITGCKCAATNKKPDVGAGEVGSWSVTGCVSAGHQITGYEWTGATAVDGSPSLAMQPLAKKNDVATPVVKVANDDNTVVTVPCDTVIAIDSNDPDYILTKQNSKIALPKGESTLVLDLPASWHAGNSASPKIRCDGANQPIVITIGTKSSLSDYSATIEIPVEQTINKSAVLINLSVGANCQVE